MGTIQPSRFLSHSGKILAGVRRVVQIPAPAAGADWSITVPAGVQWRLLQGRAIFTAAAGSANDYGTPLLEVDGVNITDGTDAIHYTAARATIVGFVTDPAVVASTISRGGNNLCYPFTFMPQGSVLGVVTTGIQPTDQWSGVGLWVEEVYFTDAQLSEIARTRAELDREIAQYEFEQATAAGGNA